MNGMDGLPLNGRPQTTGRLEFIAVDFTGADPNSTRFPRMETTIAYIKDGESLSDVYLLPLYHPTGEMEVGLPASPRTVPRALLG